ncbi:conserved Plasmodium protein, unknown function [Plasmodium knowlesi strain H]|uniref:Uncharacterized protein n=3 Tax=Plasmodium knowlesi TaxID=5850 RepID=A0A5K1U3Y3_PLAKH|nr:conserved protein, unknown function [Plasmodium knowlesi strain H]OTN64201.1 Uncharacterized protein PKNOH_S140241300 [Plasmodium knowlesi]CAA9990835.1 conserved protein, unknown function [Plasmodium knowlesi strain H]SBO20975.1 conserved Plasmodium protein, unknown function [Plasmodium knowlesi strain H]SBO21469.1 conserved Plasmodium protein, unknown function [Plasmodium knowlesi strain H]VVS80309.1 conserved protein, unknown function [Plasmodium knowlesi strain H]|eukprot:XP_002262123.1 hypothetical protein, conserved in Plasmodium species [Plasmodium knowlesi strain H]
MSSSSFSRSVNDNDDDDAKYKNETSKRGRKNDKVECEKRLKNKSHKNRTGDARKCNGGSDSSSSPNFKNQHRDKHKQEHMKISEAKNDSENRKSSKGKRMKHKARSSSSSYDKYSNKKRKKDKEKLHKLKDGKNEDTLRSNKGRRTSSTSRRKKHYSDSEECERENFSRGKIIRHRNSKRRKSISRSSCLDERRGMESHSRSESRSSGGSSYDDSSSGECDPSGTSSDGSSESSSLSDGSSVSSSPSDGSSVSSTPSDGSSVNSSPSDGSSVSRGLSKKRRVETEQGEETKAPMGDSPSGVKKKEEYEAHIYDSKEMIRLTISILQNYNFLNNLKILYQKLDKKKKISLESMKDLKLKKKLRHLFRAWKLEKEGEFYRKPHTFKENIMDIFNSLMYYFLSRLDVNKLRRNINKRKASSLKRDNPKEHDNQDGRVNSSRDDYDIDNTNYYDSNFIVNFQEEDYSHVMQNTKEKMKSLRELHEEGCFTNSKEQYKEFLEKHKKIDLWGKNEQEQKFLLNSKNSVNERRTFDRETDLAINRFVKKDDYRKLINRTKQHVDDKFHKTGDRV